MRRGISIAVMLAAMAVTGQASAASLQQQLLAPDGRNGEDFGWSVAIDGDTAVVGAPFANSGTGAAYEYVRSGDVWNFAAKLTASNGQPDDHLGLSVAIDGDVIVAGVPGNDTGYPDNGAVYTFARTGGALRTEVSRLFALASGPNYQIGSSVAIDGDEIVAGAFAAPGGGVLFTFPSTGGPVINELAKLHGSDATNQDSLGRTVDIDGDTIVTGSAAHNGNRGEVYTFPRVGGSTETGRLTASDAAAGDFMGGGVAIDGDTILAGAPGVGFNGYTVRGAAYTFARTGAVVRNETAKLVANDPQDSDELGSGLALNSDQIFVGAMNDDVGANADQGSIYTFSRTGGTRFQSGNLSATAGAAGDMLGPLAVDGNELIAGESSHDVGSNNDQGSATVFYDSAPPPPPPAADTTPPNLDLTAATSEKIRKTIKVTATCDEACSLTVNGSVKPKGDDRSQLKPATVELGAGVATTIKVKLGKIKHALKDAGKGKAKLSAVATDAAGNASAADKAKVKLD